MFRRNRHRQMTAHVANRIRNGEEAICSNKNLSTMAKEVRCGPTQRLQTHRIATDILAKDPNECSGSTKDLKIVSQPAERSQ